MGYKEKKGFVHSRLKETRSYRGDGKDFENESSSDDLQVDHIYHKQMDQVA